MQPVDPMHPTPPDRRRNNSLQTRNFAQRLLRNIPLHPHTLPPLRALPIPSPTSSLPPSYQSSIPLAPLPHRQALLGEYPSEAYTLRHWLGSRSSRWWCGGAQRLRCAGQRSSRNADQRARRMDVAGQHVSERGSCNGGMRRHMAIFSGGWLVWGTGRNARGRGGGGEGPWARVGIGIPGERVISAWWMGRYLHG